MKLIVDESQYDKDKLTIEAEQQKEHQLVLIAQMKPKRGHTLWEYNELTSVIAPAKYELQTINFELAAKGDTSLQKKVIVNPNCKYVLALNKQTALVNITKGKTGSAPFGFANLNQIKY
jgi:hypothetical protein